MSYRTYFVYVMAHQTNSVLYIGVTNDLERRIWEHRQKLSFGFAEKYNITKLVYFEETNSIVTAIEREKQLKNWSRKKKLWLIKQLNPGLKDLLM